MLFITNRVLNEGPESQAGRSVSFDLSDTNALQSVFFCERTGTGQYKELLSIPFFEKLRSSLNKQILLYIHGFNNLPEDRAFQQAEILQQLLINANLLVEVVPVIWPCVDRTVDNVLTNYLSDQLAADASGTAFARAFAKFEDFQTQHADPNDACNKRISVLAHSMGNRVLRESLRIWCDEIRRTGPPMLFRNCFLAAADIVNESLNSDGEGRYIHIASRNTVVYFASDDLALRASKVVNARDVSRRLGHTGPFDMTQVPASVYAIDCDEVNTRYDSPTGHTYFLNIPGTANPGKVFDHLARCLQTGRVEAGELTHQLIIA
jgi:esterase/lipase superfamily enzyme